MNKPIITSLLDTDFYKYKMLYFLWKMRLTEIKVSYKLYNRSNVYIHNYIDKKEFNKQIDNLFSLRFSYNELAYLSKFFELDFIEWLSSTKMGINNRDYTPHDFQYTGDIGNIILFETPVMAIINQLYREGIHNKCSNLVKNLDNEKDYMVTNLLDKLYKLLNSEELKNCNIIEFGTRRRASLEWQRRVLKTMHAHKVIKSTSNVMLAKELDIRPVGTLAHEMFMFQAAYSNYKPLSQKDFVFNWNNIFPSTYYLTDTYGTEWFLKNINAPMYGLRHDSGNPDKFIELVEKYNYKIKNIMFSDGLDENKIIELASKYSKKYNLSFGWGTNLTNDGIIKPISIVVKLSGLQGKDGFYKETIKLSDNIAKAIGTQENIEYYKELFNYPNNVENTECVY